MEQKDQQIGVLKVFKTSHTTNKKPDKHEIPIVFMVRFKKGASPVYTTYKSLRNQHPQILIDYFQTKIIFRDGHLPNKNTQNQFLSQNFHDQRENYKEPQKQMPVKETKSMRNTKLKKNSPKKENIKDISMVSESRPVRSCRFRNQYMRDNPRELRGYQHEREQNHISQSIHEQERQIIEKSNHKTQPELKGILDYDYLIEESYCLNLISPAVIPPIKQKHDFILHPPIAYQLPPRINFKQFEQQPFSSQEYKDEDQSQYLIDERGKQKRRREKLLKEQQKMNKKKKSRKIKKKIKGKGKAK